MRMGGRKEEEEEDWREGCVGGRSVIIMSLDFGRI